MNPCLFSPRVGRWLLPAVFLCTGTAVAQSSDLAAPQRLLPDRLAIHTGADDPRGGAYGTWAMGRDYKVSFHGEGGVSGMSFVPRLGVSRPHNLPLSWHTLSVRVGERELITGPAEPMQRGDFRYEYDLGGVVEAYDVLPEGLEQTFVIAAAPVGLGDLVVRGRVDGPLQARPMAPQHGELLFLDDEGAPIIAYGSATAVDAAGRRGPMTTSHRDGVVELRLDGAWLLEAEFPVVVDPLLGARYLGVLPGTAPGFLETDVVLDSFAGPESCWTAVAFANSASDWDLVLYRGDEGWANPFKAAPFGDVSSTWSSREPQVTEIEGIGRIVCVFTRDYGSFRSVCWHTTDRASQLVRTDVRVLDDPNGSTWRPDVGGSYGTAGYGLGVIVYQFDPGQSFLNTFQSEIHGLVIDFAQPNNGGIVHQRVLFDEPGYDAEFPAVQQRVKCLDVNDNPTWWSPVFQRLQVTTSPDVTWAVGGCAFNDFGGVFQSFHTWKGVLPPNAANGERRHRLRPKVAGDPLEVIHVQCASKVDFAPTNPPSSGVGEDLVNQTGRFVRSSLSFQQIGDPKVTDSAIIAEIETGAACFDTRRRRHGLFLYRKGAGTWMQLAGYSGGTVTDFRMIQLNAANASAPGGISHNRAQTHFEILYQEGPTSGPALLGDTYKHPVLFAPFYFGTDCSPMTLTYEGVGLVGSGPATLIASQPLSYPNLMSHTVYASVGTVSLPLTIIPGLSGCDLLVDIGPGLYFIGAGATGPGLSTEWNFLVPDAVPGIDYHAQMFSYDVINGSFHITNRITVPLRK